MSNLELVWQYNMVRNTCLELFRVLDYQRRKWLGILNVICRCALIDLVYAATEMAS
jgi:hypothetical protein